MFRAIDKNRCLACWFFHQLVRAMRDIARSNIAALTSRFAPLGILFLAQTFGGTEKGVAWVASLRFIALALGQSEPGIDGGLEIVGVIGRSLRAIAKSRNSPREHFAPPPPPPPK